MQSIFGDGVKAVKDDKLSVSRVFSDYMKDPRVKKGLRFLEEDGGQTLQEQKDICEIPSAPFNEEKRAQDYLGRLRKLGLEDISQDESGNVFGLRRGTGGGPKLVVAAHLDTVFSLDDDFHVHEENGKLHAPSIADDTRGLAEILSVARAFNASGIETCGDIMFCGDVGEEGLGDLRGMRRLFSDHKDIDGFISLDGFNGVGNITSCAIGTHRYRITFYGPGGHSMYDFGAPSAVHAIGRAIAAISDLHVPAEPLTTFTVGKVSGGTSVNAIASEASMLLDIRSGSSKVIRDFELEVKACIENAVKAENKRWNLDGITVKIELVGNRPAGSQPPDATIVEAACESCRAFGIEPEIVKPGSTDANIPLSLGIPAVTLDCGGRGFGTHSLKEFYDPANSVLGPKRAFLLILGLAGIKGLNAPLLPRRQ